MIKYNIFVIFVISWSFAFSIITETDNISNPLLENCCQNITGNINGDENDQIDISDLVYYVAFSFSGGSPPPCIDEADLDCSGSLDISDIVYLVTYSFSGGPSPLVCPTLVNIRNLQPNDNIVQGTARVPDTSLYKVVLWAKTNRWYVQPSIAEPFTFIQGDSTWSNSTYPWDRVVALLVDTSYEPGSILDEHPSLDAGVVDWDEYPEKSIRFINWSGYRWKVKTGDFVDPGPNYFSDDSVNVWIDQFNRMHLRIDHRNNKWYCSEIVLDHSLGYGLYTLKISSRVDSLDFNTILGCFIYETLNEEFDIEFSQRLANPYNAQYVAQPWYNSGNIEFFSMPTSSQSTHLFEWRADSIIFKSWSGHEDNPEIGTIIHSWIYTGDDIPIPGGERMIFNLYLYDGDTPLQGEGDEVIIESFEFTE